MYEQHKNSLWFLLYSHLDYTIFAKLNDSYNRHFHFYRKDKQRELYNNTYINIYNFLYHYYLKYQKCHECFFTEVETHDKNVIKLPIVTELQRLFAKSGITGIQRRMNERLFRWKDITINLAILGNSGTGKSSFINAIRG